MDETDNKGNRVRVATLVWLRLCCVSVLWPLLFAACFVSPRTCAFAALGSPNLSPVVGSRTDTCPQSHALTRCNYDGTAKAAPVYDAAAVHTTSESAKGPVGSRVLSAAFAKSVAAETGAGFINPSEVRFTQDSIGALFKNGQSIDNVARALRGPGGADLAASFPPIRLVEKEGLLWTLDNRRLATFSAGGQQIPFRMATEAEITAEWGRKFTTTAEQGWGQFITVRPPPGFKP